MHYLLTHYVLPNIGTFAVGLYVASKYGPLAKLEARAIAAEAKRDAQVELEKAKKELAVLRAKVRAKV